MQCDVMVIRKKNPAKADLVLGSDNQIAKKVTCPIHTRYKGIRKPLNCCLLCWVFWSSKRPATTN